MNGNRFCSSSLPVGVIDPGFCAGERIQRSPDALRPQKGQPFAMLVEIHQGKSSAQAVKILLQAAEADLHESEHSLQDAERMFHSGSHSGLGTVLSAL
jgi:hypothetical protein